MRVRARALANLADTKSHRSDLKTRFAMRLATGAIRYRAQGAPLPSLSWLRRIVRRCRVLVNRRAFPMTVILVVKHSIE
jgi:hypothetical protein